MTKFGDCDHTRAHAAASLAYVEAFYRVYYNRHVAVDASTVQTTKDADSCDLLFRPPVRATRSIRLYAKVVFMRIWLIWIIRLAMSRRKVTGRASYSDVTLHWDTI